jgi:exopolysaccharide production protein ExoZ
VGEGKNPGLQAARAVAALAVAYFHSYIALRIYPETAQHQIPFLKEWGFLGVNFFFAISGYVVCLVASKPSFTARGFIIKRAFRLYPLYWTALAAVAFMILIGRYPAQSVGHFLYSMTLLPQPSASVYDVSWTLEREIVFYALATITIPIVGIAGLALVLATLAFSGYLYGNPWSFHLVSTIQADFLGGVLIFLIGKHIRPNFTASISLIVAGSFALWYTRTHDFAFAPTLSLALVLCGMIHLKLSWGHWSLHWLVRLGDASYSLYLWHLLGFMISFILSFKIGFHPDWMCEPWRYGAIACCALFSVLTWERIERPMIDLGNRLARLLDNPNDVVTDDRGLHGLMRNATRVVRNDVDRVTSGSGGSE